MVRSVSVSSDRNIRDHLWRWSTFETNRFFALIREFGRVCLIIGQHNFFWSIRGDAGIILIFLQHNTVVSENCEKSKQILPATRSKMYKVDKSGNILGT